MWLPTVNTVTDCGGALGAAEEVIRINTNYKSLCTSILFSEYEYEDKMHEVLVSSSSKFAYSIQK